MTNWDDVQYFLAIIRQGSLQAAADNLGVNQSTVFRRLRALEEYLGTRIFDHRHRGRYALTPAGEALEICAHQIENAMLDVENLVRGKDLQLSGSIRVATAEDIAVSLLPRHLNRFEREHPEITVELLTDNRYYSLTRNEADVAIRPGYSTDEDRVIAKKVCSTGFGFYANDEYLNRFGIPDSREALTNHRLIEWRKELIRDKYARDIFSSFGGPHRYGGNSMGTIRALAAEGLGIGILPEFFGSDEPRLNRILPELRIDSGHIWILHHSEMRHSARVQVFIEFMTIALRSDPQLQSAVSLNPQIPSL